MPLSGRHDEIRSFAYSEPSRASRIRWRNASGSNAGILCYIHVRAVPAKRGGGVREPGNCFPLSLGSAPVVWTSSKRHTTSRPVSLAQTSVHRPGSSGVYVQLWTRQKTGVPLCRRRLGHFWRDSRGQLCLNKTRRAFRALPAAAGVHYPKSAAPPRPESL